MPEPLTTSTTRTPGRWRSALDVVGTIVMVVAALAMLWRTFGTPAASAPPSAPAGRSPISLPSEPVSLEGVPVLGSAGAKLILLMFSEFQCPFCSRFANETAPLLKEKYIDTGRLRFAFRHLPLPIHDRARQAAEGAECARRQGKFWPMHDALFTPPMRLAEADLAAHAGEAGLDMHAFQSCMSGEAVGRVQDDVTLARTLGVTVTPAFIVGVGTEDGRLRAVESLVGAKPLSEFESVLNQVMRSSN